MLSKKMAFSLTSLITILALAFVVTPAMAGEFGVSLDTTNDASAADKYQLLHPGDGMTITLTVEFDKAVVLGKESVQIITLDKAGKLLSLQKFPAAAEKAADAGRVKTFKPKVEAKATTVKLLIAAGIASADPFNTDTSKKLEGTIGLVGADDGPPTVNSIERVGVNFRQIKTPKISPTANPTVQVRITLSEMPKEFKTDHINVTEADVTSVVQLVPEGGTSLADFAASDDAPDSFPRTRGMYDEEIPARAAAPADDATDGLEGTDTVTLTVLAEGDVAALRTNQLKVREMYGGIHRAINEAKMLTGTAYKYKMVPLFGGTAPTVATPLADLDPDTTDVEFGFADAEYTLKTAESQASVAIGSAGAQATPEKPKKTVAKPTKIPNAADYAQTALYDLALAKYAADFDEYAANANLWAQYNAYTAAVKAEKMKDEMAQMEAYEKLSASLRAAASVPTGRDAMVYPYLVTITPKYANKNNVVVKVKEFEDLTSPVPERYIPPRLDSAYVEGIDKLTIEVAEAKVGAPLGAGLEVVIPKEIRIPANGFTVFAKNNDGSGIKDNPGNDKDEPKPAERTPAQLKYNLVELGGLPNLETFLSNGGTIALVAPATGLYISEIMWGSDSSLSPNNNSQWIEIANSGTSSILTGDKTHKLIFYGLNETPATTGVVDTVGTVGTEGYWSLTGIGQSGRTGTGEKAADVVAVVPTLELISMQRRMNAAGTPAAGTLKGSWVQSKAPAVNFDPSKVGTRIGTPGAPIDAAKYPTVPTPAPEPAPAPVVPVAMANDIAITEIMVDTGNNRLPQWIELVNMSGAEKSLDGWSVEISNSSADANVVGRTVSINLSGTIGVGGGEDRGGDTGQAVLLVAWGGRSSSNLSKLGDRLVNVSGQLDQKGRYTLLSPMGFMIELLPPQTTGVVQFGDSAGNLGASPAWDIPRDEDGRSSLIRHAMLADGTATMGTDANGWVLASGTNLVDTPATWYGSDEDAGTPGVIGGGPLPVELSHFRPARDKATGAVVITWATQSELNNAGFFIKRSNQKDGEFKVVNPTMIPGAGTTSEKQFYTYTDTTAQPNIVYYYQIEDVSLDGNRQTLTRGIRLKGHIGAAGKLTSTWGELKSSNE